jgi:ATP-dependent DNA helicase RecG
MDLSDSIGTIKFVGPGLQKVFHKKGIRTLEDALFFIPRTYEDRRKLSRIQDLHPGQTATLLVTVVNQREMRQRGASRFEVTASDGAGSVRLFWFRSYPSLKEDFCVGNRLLVHGEVAFYGGFARLTHPDYEVVKETQGGKPVPSYHFGRIVPIYSETPGLPQKTLRRVIAQVLKASLELLDETLSDALRARLHLPSLRESFVGLHFPKELPDSGRPEASLQRIAFEEFFVLQLGLGLKKRGRQLQKGRAFGNTAEVLAAFEKQLPFSLTQDQKTAIEATRADLARSQSMSRLIQGDVGSGKTVVALAAAAIVAKSGAQTALMAPTELLAQQHFRTAQKLLGPLGIECILFSQETASLKATRDQVKANQAKVVIGTHALFQQKVEFGDLGLVIVDEQHRFGVDQRGELMKKNSRFVPHLLMMTATPIPRTLALTMYGDLDLTWIRQKPANRKPIKTEILTEKNRSALYARIATVLGKGEQVYFIYPLVEDSEKLDLKSATRMHEALSRDVFPQVPVALLHGRMKAEEKDKILSEFKAGKHRLLVSTTVIEVGIDVPNATLMVIEHPERLGLSQLHQLRGRVGRGDLDSQCVLLVEDKIPPRLRIMEQTEDGFEIAEEDLRFRGPGEFLGTAQSGLPGFRVGHLFHDAPLIAIARDEAAKVLSLDPELKLPENAKLRSMVESRWKEKIERLKGGY